MKTSAERTVVIDAYPESAANYCDEYAVISVDVIRATTVAVTSVACGRECLIARDLADALAIRDQLGDALLAGEVNGNMPQEFEMNNSPADLAARLDVHRPLVMLSSSGTKLMLQASRSREAALVACFRNAAATAAYAIGNYRHVAIIGAGSRNEFREEDQICCAWIGAALAVAGYRMETSLTTDVIRAWENAPATACAGGNSVRYLRRSGQMHDFDFVTQHVNDLEFPVLISGNQVATFKTAEAA